MATEGDRERTGLLTTPEGAGNLITGYGAADHEDVERGRAARQPRAQNANAGPDGAADHKDMEGGRGAADLEDMEGGRGAADLEDDVEGGPRAQNANTRAGPAVNVCRTITWLFNQYLFCLVSGQFIIKIQRPISCKSAIRY